MSGKTNLKEILQNINPYLLDESFVFITSCEPIEDLPYPGIRKIREYPNLVQLY